MNKIREILSNLKFIRVYILINDYLYVYENNIVENIKFSIIGGASSEQCN